MRIRSPWTSKGCPFTVAADSDPAAVVCERLSYRTPERISTWTTWIVFAPGVGSSGAAPET